MSICAHSRQGPHPGGRQTTKHLYCAVWSGRHSTDPLPCLFCLDTRQSSSAVAITVVSSLTCVCTRQRVYRGQKQLCRVNGIHSRACISGSEGLHSANKVKLGELHIRLKNCNTPKMMEGQCADYAAIHATKRGPSPYPPGACTPLKRGRDPPCGEAVTIIGGCPYTGR
jgi:hypothetical protein